jgi:divalent metal cation (Fe/Co/Zn/Cd) transporter
MVRQLHDQVRRSVEHGLIPEDFHARQIGARLQASAKNATYRADTEILCTDAWARLAVTIEFGKLDPSSLDRAWNFNRSVDGQNVISLVNGALNGGTAIWLAVETHGLLIGESANPKVLAAIREVVGRSSAIDEIHEVTATHMGPEYVVVNLSVGSPSTATAAEVESVAAQLDRDLKAALLQGRARALRGSDGALQRLVSVAVGYPASSPPIPQR